MIFKNYVKKLILYSLVFYVAFSALFNLLIDPYGKYNIVNIEGFNRYKYVYEQQEVLNKFFHDSKIDTLIFGTSRSAVMGRERYFKNNNYKVLNLSDAIYGNPKDIYNYLHFTLKYPNNIKRVFIGIDYHVYAKKSSLWNLRNDLYYSDPHLYYYIASLVKLTPLYNHLSFYTIEKNLIKEQPKAPQDDYGIREYLHETLDKKNIKVTGRTKKLLYQESDFENYKEIYKLLKSKGIDAVFYTFPSHKNYYKTDFSYNEVSVFNKKLGSYIPYHNFAYINKITKNPENYFDFSHFV